MNELKVILAQLDDGIDHKGLGDTVEKVLEKTGIAKVVKTIAGKRCACQQRREKLNKLFPYKDSRRGTSPPE